MDNKLLDNKDINLNSLRNVFDNAGFKTEIIDGELVIQKESIKSIIYIRSDLVSIVSKFRLKPDLDNEIIESKLVQLNHGTYPARYFTNDDKKTLIISITYFTGVGIYIPHFILTANAYLGFIPLDFKRVDCSDILV